jgi:ligand-binding SRPBCC domain-containing protein
MSHLELSTSIAAPIERCFDLSRNIDAHLGSMDFFRERAIGGVTSGLIGAGESVTWEAQHLGVRWRMTSTITEFEPPVRFVDEMQRGPFASFRHEHRFTPHGGTTTMLDAVDYRVPMGPLGAMADKVLLARYLRHVLEVRNDYLKRTAEDP